MHTSIYTISVCFMSEMIEYKTDNLVWYTPALHVHARAGGVASVASSISCVDYLATITREMSRTETVKCLRIW